MDDSEPAKRAAGEAAAELVTDGMTLGLGTGSTARWFIEAVGARVRSGLAISAVATSLASAQLAARQGLVLVELDSAGVDLAVDGADLVDPDLRLVKGLGGALVRERIVAAAAQRFVVVADEGKLRAHLSGPVPVEVLAFGWPHTATLLAECGASFQIRRDGSGRPLRSDNGNLIADGSFGAIEDPEGLAARLDAIPGVVGHGLFLGMTDEVIVGAADGSTRTVTAGAGPGTLAPPSIAAAPTLSWRALEEGWRVLDRDGSELGVVHRVLAAEHEDIFRGVLVKRGLLGTEWEILSDRIDRIDEGAVRTSLAPLSEAEPDAPQQS
jgi:ribose 5-phosphate isomerase A